jgi:uncharacterized protein involved in response to NO
MSFTQQFFRHPLWLVGFRSLFALGFISGMVLPMLWYLMYSNRISFDSSVSPLQWHVHEMYFGFGWAVLGGFLLTASKNWAGVRGHHGWVLVLVCLFWLFDRLAFWLPAGLPQIVPLLLHNAFLLLIVPLILWTLLNALDKIGKDNWYFILGLPFFIVSKNLLFTDQYFELGWTMSQGLFRLAVAMMLERTVFQFMKMGYQVEIAQIKWLDASIRLGLFIAVFEVLLPRPVAIAVLAITASMLLYRFMLWHPMKGLRKLDTGVMYVAYLGLLSSMYLECLRLAGMLHVVGDVATHVFTLLGMGLVMAAMMIRISQGHTARNIVFTASDKAAIWLAGLGGVVRLVLPQIWPQQYENFVLFAAFSWGICFLVLGWRLIPFLFKPRLDGKES